MDETAREPVLVDLALQGGGSHGAFTWGVIDRLLEEPWLRIEAISGTSAGAMNAALVADGWTQGGAGGARAALEAYWRRVSQAAAFSPLQRSPLDRLMGRWTLDTSPAYVIMDMMARVISPYDLNPLGLNPLRNILAESIDFGRVARAPIKLLPRPMFVPAEGASSATRRSRPTSCLPRLVCRPCSRRLRSTAIPIGTAAMPAIRPLRR
jgi:NTE family protein